MPVTITNGYCTLAQLKAEKGISDTTDDDTLSVAINAASRQIDNYCGRRFWQDGSVVAREYFPASSVQCDTDDISTITGLIVKVDIDLDGTFETTLVINTDFLVAPRNAALEVPVRPYTELSIVPIGVTSFFPQPRYGRASVQVTAKFGWPAVPDDVTKGCLIQAAMLAKAKDAPFGGVELGAGGAAMFMRSKLHSLAEALLAPYARPALG